MKKKPQPYPQTFKASYLNSKSAPRLNQKFINQQVVQSEYLAKLGGLRLLELYRSSSPKRKEIREKLLLESSKPLKSARTPECTQNEKSFEILKSRVDVKANFLFNFELDKKDAPKKLIIVGNNDFGREFTLSASKSLSNISRVTLDSSVIPQVSNNDKWEKMINFAEFKSRLKSPFR